MKGMTKLRKDVLCWGSFVVLASSTLCTLVPSALGQTAAPEALPANESTSVGLAGEQGIVETPRPEQVVQAVQLQSTPWGTPVLVSPANGTALYHYPRTTTLIWEPVTGAVSYRVESAYLSGSTWVAYPAVTVSGSSNASYTFSFVGDQKGRWRVTAFDGTNYSAASGVVDVLVQHHVSNGNAPSDQSRGQRSFRPIPAQHHPVMENGTCCGGLQTRDSLLHV